MFKLLALVVQFSLVVTDTPIKVALIQGCSASGKTTLSKYFYNRLAESGINTVVISADNYYHTFPYELTFENIQKYDFDNPKAIDWYALRDTLKAYSNRDSDVPCHKYDFTTKMNTKTMVKNIFPEVIIIEGILAFNIFNKSLINFPEMDPMDSGKEISSDYIQNDLLDGLNFTVNPRLRFLLKISKDKLIKIRLARDKKCRKVKYADQLSESQIEERIRDQIERNVWPATKKWVYSRMNEPYVEISGGTFNIKRCELISEEALYLLGSEKKQLFKAYIKDVLRE